MSFTARTIDPSLILVGTTIAAITSLLVCSGDNKVSTKDAFTLFENNSGWTNSKPYLFLVFIHTFDLIYNRWVVIFSGVYRADVDPHWL